MRHTKPGLRATLPQRLLGHRADGRPIWWQQGANNDGTIVVEDEPDDTEDLDDDDDDPDGSAGDDDWTPPSRAEHEKLQADLAAQRRTNRELGQIRALLKRQGITVDDLRNGRRGNTDDPDDSHDDDPPVDTTADDKKDKPTDAAIKRRIDREVTRATARVEETYKPVVVELAAKAALLDAGWSGKDLKRVMKMIDSDEIEVDGGEIVGLNEQIEGIKEEFPEWFKKRNRGEPEDDDNGSSRGRRRRPPRRDVRDIDGGDRTPAPEPETWKEKLSKQLNS